MSSPDTKPTPPSTSVETSKPTETEQLNSFERWRRTAMVITGLGLTEQKRKEYFNNQAIETCTKVKEDLMATSPLLVFLQKHLKLCGCEVPPQNIACGPCDATHAGGFNPRQGAVFLCAANFFSKQHMESTIAHELIHMYDYCKFNVDMNNLRHHACTEIRANSLSGDCRYTREMRRGVFSFTKNHQACVRRRSITSVLANPNCPDQETAEKAVNEVFDSCFQDTRPFDEIY